MDTPAPPSLADGDFEKESYVPLSFARERVALVTQQMFDMKARHVETVGELSAQYRQIEEDTREYYVGFIRQLQDKMKIALAQHSNARRQAARELARVQRTERDHAERSKEELGALANEKRKALESAQAVRQAQETEFNEELKRRDAKSSQQRSALDQAATDLARERARADELSQALSAARERNESVQLELEHSSVRNYAVDSTMRALLSTLECECGSEQVRRQQQELEQLQEQLQRARQDASAFRERVEDERSEMTQVLLERAAAVKEAEERADVAEKQALLAQGQAQTQAQAQAQMQAAATVPTPVVVSSPTSSSTSVPMVTPSGTALTTAEATARAAKFATSAAAAAAEAGALASAVAQLASASELVSTLTNKLQEQSAALENCESDKKAKKGDIKRWLKDFKKREGREATRQDKEAARPIYEKYQDADRELEKAGAAVRDATSELEAAAEAEKAAAAAVRAAQDAYSSAAQLSEPIGGDAKGDTDTRDTADSTDDNYEYDTSDVAQLRADLRAARVGQQELRAQLLALTESIEAQTADSGAGGDEGVDDEAQAAYAKKVKELEAQHAVETQSLQQELDEARKSAELAQKQHEEQQNARTKAQESITAGKDLMIIGAKTQCRTQFEEVAEWLLSSLPRTVGGVEQLEAALKTSRDQADGPAAKTLRRALDVFATTTAEVEEAAKQLEQATQRADEMKRKLEEHQRDKPEPAPPKPKPKGGARRGPSPAEAAAAARAKAAELQVAELQRELRAADRREKKQQRETTRGGGGGSSGGADPAKLRALQKQAKEDSAKIKQLTAALQKAKAKANTPGTPSHGGGQQKAAEQRLAEKDKKHKKAMSEAAKEHERALGAASKKAAKAIKELEGVKKELEEVTAARDKLQRKAAALKELEQRADELQAKADQVPVLQKELEEQKKSYGSLEGKYKEEQALRKKYHNIIEDMKGKIRVYARCRPMAKYELEKDCSPVVSFRDESTLALTTKRGDRDFTYDAVFSPAHTQADVFEDTRHLCQSAFDGFNVCIFAYGQTGSGKTFTMTGAPGNPGLTPRAINEMFSLMESQKDISRTAVSCYFVELYNDALVDLLWKVDHKGSKEEPPRLDIKKNQKGMVVIKGVTTKPADTAEELLELFDQGNACRAVGSTKMNAESSRSHSIFGVLLSTYNFTTKKTAVGKLSLVDLAGSERVGKTGATKDRLREAMSINKSLSALGDVISALSTNAKFVPYRNNKLTQLMQDSLGGNAKTLMFVNISPADYNAEETQTSLAYASRVKLITNDAAKNQDNAEITKLKKIIANLKAGGTGELSDDDDDE